MGNELPFEVHGFSTHMEEVDIGTGSPFVAPTTEQPINHRVYVTTARAFLRVEVGDELGSRVVAARLVRELMHLAFLLEQQYMAYSKWLGTAFARLRCAAELQPVHGRPFLVVHGDRFAASLERAIEDEEVKRLPPNFGSRTQWIESTDVLYPRWSRRLAGLYVVDE